MKEIVLTQGQVALVDDEDFEKLNQFKWYAHSAGYNWYAARRNNRKFVYMHRLIMNAQKDEEVDHINGNGLHNYKVNMRLCTHQQNNVNKPMRRDNKTGIKGVRWDKTNKGKPFQAQLHVKGKHVYCKNFNNIKSAEFAYKTISNKYFGEFAGIKII